jgi:hypothetical protein
MRNNMALIAILVFFILVMANCVFFGLIKMAIVLAILAVLGIIAAAIAIFVGIVKLAIKLSE